MSEEKFSKTRFILGDVTNRIGKRGFSFVKSGDVFSENVANKEKGSILPENSDKKKCLTKRVLISCNEINSLGRNVISGKITCTSSSNMSVPPSPANVDCIDGGKGKKDDDVQLVNSVCMNGGNDFSVDNLDSSKCGSVEFLGFPDSQESRASGLERPVGEKGDRCSNSIIGVDLIKSCACSFCAKAAYIWSDLHYQDIKGRIAALKKSQQEASILVQSSCRKKEIEKHGQESCRKFSKLESDLTGQWRSLFLHMEDIFGRESSHLESSLVTLNDLRENCKTELEVDSGVPSE